MDLHHVSDIQLGQLINKIGPKYDPTFTGCINDSQLPAFFMDLYRLMGYNVQISYQSAHQALVNVSHYYNGKATKKDLINGWRYLNGNQNTYFTVFQQCGGYQPYVFTQTHHALYTQPVVVESHGHGFGHQVVYDTHHPIGHQVQVVQVVYDTHHPIGHQVVYDTHHPVGHQVVYDTHHTTELHDVVYQPPHFDSHHDYHY